MLNQLGGNGATRQLIQEFGGYDHRKRISAGSFYDMDNMTCDEYPILSTRKKKKRIEGTFKSASGMQIINKNLYFITEYGADDTEPGYYLFKNGKPITERKLNDKTKKTTIMGAYIVIFPDKVRFNTLASDSGSAFEELEVNYSKSVSATLCDSLYRPIDVSGASSATGVNAVRFVIAISANEKEIIDNYSAANVKTNALKDEINAILTKTEYSDSYIYFIVDEEEKEVLKYTKSESGFDYGEKLGAADVNDVLFYDMRNNYLHIKDTSGDTVKWGKDTPYVKLSGDGIGSAFDRRDAVNIQTASSALGECNYIDGERIIYKVSAEDDSIYIQGIGSADVCEYGENEIQISRPVPDMDYICEYNNRLCGCKFSSGESPINEIYISKLGSPGNFTVGTGTDATGYIMSCGMNGEFTGIAKYQNYLCVFKENGAVLINSYFSSSTVAVPGVAVGSHDSLKRFGDYLAYLSADGVYLFNGSKAWKISDVFGETPVVNGCAAVLGDKYYLTAVDNTTYESDKLNAVDEAKRKLAEEGVNPDSVAYKLKLPMYALAFLKKHLEEESNSTFVYDVKKGVWTKEKRGTMILTQSSDGRCIYSIDITGKLEVVRGNAVQDNTDLTETDEGDFSWFVRTGEIGYSMPDNKYVNRISVRMNLPNGSSMRMLIRYDGGGEYTPVSTVTGQGRKSVTVPIIPRKCETFSIRAEGRGECEIISAAVQLSEGSDVF